MKRTFVILYLTTLFLFCGCNVPYYNAFRVEKTEFKEQTKTIGILPIEVDAALNEYFGIEVEETAEVEFEHLLGTKLEEAGFNVIPASEYRRIEDTIEKTVGLSDNQKLDATQRHDFEFVEEHTRKEYLREHHVDAFACAEIIITTANSYGINAYWHGATEPATGQKGVLEYLLMSNTYGSMPALSLKLNICDLNDNLQYRYFGGIQLLRWVRIIPNFKDTFQDVPKEHIFSVHERNAKSIEIACAPLIFDELPKEYKLANYDSNPVE